MKTKRLGILCALICWLGIVGQQRAYTSVQADADWAAFLSHHDMVWDRVLHRWEVSPYTGNSLVAFFEALTS